MADTHETTADIIAEMRGMGNYQRYSGDHARVLANRLDAAHRRERGNAAKLREALESIASNLERRLFARYPSSASDEWMYQKANTALATTSNQNTQED